MNRTRKTIASAAIVGGVLSGGAAGLLAFGSSANAADTTSTATATAATSAADTSTAATPAASSTATPAKPAGPHQANGITETLLTGDDLAKATAAANTALPGATVVRAETDADGDVYEVHVTKADGTQATVKLNADFSVKTVESGGPGGGGHGAKSAAAAVPSTVTG